MPESNQQTMPPQPPPYYYRQKKSRWWIPVVIIGVVILFFFFAIIAFFSTVGSFFSEEPVEVKPNTVLYLDMKMGVDEYSLASPFSFFGQPKASSYFDILTAIDRAKSDENIRGIYINANAAKMGFSKSYEFLKAIDDFKESGKFVYAYMDYCDEATYLKALAADKIIMPAEGLAEFNGFAITSIFFKGLLDTIGIDYYVLGFEDFKSAGEPYSRKNFSDSSRYQLKVFLDQRLDIFIKAVAKYRNISEDDIRLAMTEGILTNEKMLAYGLIDSLMTESELKELIRDDIFGADNSGLNGHKYKLMDIVTYLESEYDYGMEQKIDYDNQIAIISGVGPIVAEHSGSPFDSEEKYIVGSQFIKYLKQAREDDKIKAIILRIDSPGGSALVSDAIYREIIKTKEIKPVYASMSDVAASGGYYMSIGADTILAHPSTLTGSIGVVTAIPNFERLLGKLYLTVDTVSSNPSALTLNPAMPFSENDKEIIFKFAENIYRSFLEKVAKSRNMPVEKIRELAKGRIWTGQDAMEIGLVDKLGGIKDAIKMAKERIGVPAGQKVIIRRYPPEEDDLKVLMKLLGLEEEEENYVKENTTSIMSKLNDMNPVMDKAMASFPDDIAKQIKYMFKLVDISMKEHTLTALPFYVSEY